MKTLPLAIGGLGVLALVMGLVAKMLASGILGVSPAGYVRGASALFLLTLVVMVYDRWYGCRPEAKAADSAPPRPTP